MGAAHGDEPGQGAAGMDGISGEQKSAAGMDGISGEQKSAAGKDGISGEQKSQKAEESGLMKPGLQSSPTIRGLFAPAMAMRQPDAAEADDAAELTSRACSTRPYHTW